MFLKNVQNSQENTRVRISYLFKDACLRPATVLKGDSDADVFLWILRNFQEHLFFTEHLSWSSKGPLLGLIQYLTIESPLTLSWRGPFSYRNQSIDLPRKSMDWFLYDNGSRHKRVKNDENHFLFHVKSSFCSWDINIFVLPFCFCRKRLDEKAKVNFKNYDVTDWTTNNYVTDIVQYLNK